MGRKRTGKRKYLFLYLACCVSLLVGTWACFHVPKRRQAETSLARAETLLASGEYEASLAWTNHLLELYPKTIRDEVLFQMGLIYAHPKNPDRNYKKSEELFQRVTNYFPNGRLKDRAKIWSLFAREIADTERKIRNLERKSGYLTTGLEEEKQKTRQFQTQANSLRIQVDNLKAQLLRLKEIDLGIEQKRSRKK